MDEYIDNKDNLVVVCGDWITGFYVTGINFEVKKPIYIYKSYIMDDIIGYKDV